MNDIASSEDVYSYKGIKATPAPHFDLATEQKVQKAIAALIEDKLIESGETFPVWRKPHLTEMDLTQCKIYRVCSECLGTSRR